GGTSTNGTTATTGLSTLGAGTIFKLDPTAKEAVLHSFTGANGDGANPQGDLIQDSANNLYGTTVGGGETTGLICGAPGCGTIFRLAPSGAETVLHQFEGTDGFGPEVGLLRDSKGNLYGATSSGGDN